MSRKTGRDGCREGRARGVHRMREPPPPSPSRTRRSAARRGNRPRPRGCTHRAPSVFLTAAPVVVVIEAMGVRAAGLEGPLDDLGAFQVRGRGPDAHGGVGKDRIAARWLVRRRARPRRARRRRPVASDAASGQRLAVGRPNDGQPVQRDLAGPATAREAVDRLRTGQPIDRVAVDCLPTKPPFRFEAVYCLPTRPPLRSEAVYCLPTRSPIDRVALDRLPGGTVRRNSTPKRS